MPRLSLSRLGLWSVAALVALIAWDLLAMDLALARWFGNSSGFPLRDHWLFSGILHQGARRVAWTLQLALLLAIWWPIGVLRRLTRRERLHLLTATLINVLLVWLLKNSSQTSCPWDLKEFGGTAVYLSHWRWGVSDGGVGACFPAGHASAAFSFVSGYFWLRAKAPRAAALWLTFTLLAGFAVGMAQQVRGAHYMSHTLWTAWLCWVFAGLSYLVLERSPLRKLFASSANRGR